MLGVDRWAAVPAQTLTSNEANAVIFMDFNSPYHPNNKGNKMSINSIKDEHRAVLKIYFGTRIDSHTGTCNWGYFLLSRDNYEYGCYETMEEAVIVMRKVIEAMAAENDEDVQNEWLYNSDGKYIKSSTELQDASESIVY